MWKRKRSKNDAEARADVGRRQATNGRAAESVTRIVNTGPEKGSTRTATRVCPRSHYTPCGCSLDALPRRNLSCVAWHSRKTLRVAQAGGPQASPMRPVRPEADSGVDIVAPGLQVISVPTDRLSDAARPRTGETPAVQSARQLIHRNS